MGFRFPMSLAAVCWIAAAGLLTTPAASAKAYKIKLLLNNQTMRPDNGQPFTAQSLPVIDGDYVVFTTFDGCCTTDAVWSINIKNKRITKLAGLETPVPHGTGTFVNFNFTSPTVGGGMVAFSANSGDGIYTVPVKGGKIRRVVDNSMKAPDGGKFEEFFGVSLNGSQVVFSALTVRNHHGIFQASVDGSGIALVIDEKTHLSGRTTCSSETGDGIYNFDHPVIGLSQIGYIGTGGGEPVNTPTGVYTPGGPVADNLTHVQSDPSDCPHAVFGQLSAPVQNQQLAFGAFDATVFDPNTDIPFEGIFLARGIDKTATRLVTNTMKSPVSKQPFGVFSSFGLDDSGLAFTATESVGGQGVYVMAGPGAPIYNLALDPDFHSPVVGDRSISGGVVTFASNPNTGSGLSIWVATPVAP